MVNKHLIITMENTGFDNQQKVNTRPPSLTALCILTFISSGMSALSALFTPAMSDVFVEVIKMYPDIDDATKEGAIRVIQAGAAYHMITFVLYVASLTGAAMMWNLKKNGFHVYALSNLLILLVPAFMLGMAAGWGNILLTGGFIALYGTHLQEMR